MKAQVLSPGILWIESFWTAEQCDVQIEWGEAQGFQNAPIQTRFGSRVDESVRNNTRVMWRNDQAASVLWEQLKDNVPPRHGHHVACGVNEMFRLYRYTPGQQFRRHRDNSFIRHAKEASYYTLLIYLNDDFSGGETTFAHLSVIPRRGAALLFVHQLEHAGSPVLSGVKYVLRTDIMYRLSGDTDAVQK